MKTWKVYFAALINYFGKFKKNHSDLLSLKCIRMCKLMIHHDEDTLLSPTLNSISDTDAFIVSKYQY